MATKKNSVLLKNIGLGLALGGILTLGYSAVFDLEGAGFLWSCLLALLLGGSLYSYALYRDSLPGIHNDGVWFNALTNRGVWGWLLGLGLTAFYITIYFYPTLLGYHSEGKNSGLVAFFDPLSVLLNGRAATQWFVYGCLYTLAILLFGVKFMFKYRTEKYQVLRTLSIMFFQLGFAFLIPELLAKLNGDAPYFAKDLKNMWPLNYYFFEEWHLDGMLQGGSLGLLMLGFGLAMIFVISPVLTYFYGKRWYCSWVCGCGGLAETAGDPFRQLSSKKISVWKLERWMIHLVLVFITTTTLAVLWTYTADENNALGLQQRTLWYGALLFFLSLLALLGGYYRKNLPTDARYAMYSVFALVLITLVMRGWNGQNPLFGVSGYQLRAWYGFGFGAVFSGVLGVGFYPLLGSRVWCRFGCPMAAILGLQQRLFSRFRITSNGGQCISCGNCSSYCEMGIDVRQYAQRGENIVRSSCVGCGICATVCPRGVLRLENEGAQNRLNDPVLPMGNLLKTTQNG